MHDEWSVHRLFRLLPRGLIMFGLVFTLAATMPACTSTLGPNIPPETDEPDEPLPPGGDQDDK